MSTKNRSLIGKVSPKFGMALVVLLSVYLLVIFETFRTYRQYNVCRLISLSINDAFAYNGSLCNDIDCMYESNEQYVIYDALSDYEKCSYGVSYVFKEYSAYHIAINWVRTTVWPLFFYLPNSSAGNVYIYIHNGVASNSGYFSLVCKAIADPLKYLSHAECMDDDSATYLVHHDMWNYTKFIKDEEYKIDLVSGDISIINSNTIFKFRHIKSFDVKI